MHFRRMTLISMSLSCGCAVMAAIAGEPPVAPVFGPHPRVAHTAADLAAWKADPSRSNELAAAVARAEASLKADLAVPTREGQWYFYYACPKDNAYLRAETPARHVCPTCGAVYTDERTVAAYRTIRNDEINSRCRELALGYALTGDEKYAKPVRDVLLKLADLYPTWTRHDRWGRTGLLAVVGGLRYGQLLDEAASSITLAQAYDMVAPAACFSEKDRSVVENKLLKYIAQDIHGHQVFVGSRNNHQTWFNAAYATIGLATGDADLMKEAIYGSAGLLWQLENSVTEDGLWYEGANAYHFYALSAIQQTLDAAKRAGWDFSTNERLKGLWLGPALMTYPDGRIPVFHDSDPSSLSGYAGFYQWAFDYFKDPRFALPAGVPTGETKAAPALASSAMKGIGVVALRRGQGAEALCAMIDYGIHGDHHGHPDKLNLVLYGLGREWVLDPGRISYSVPEYETWCRTTLAHNTVVIDQQNQEPTTGELWFFANTNTYAASLCMTDRAYPGYVMKRFLVLTGNILVDALSVEGKKRVPMDWALHVRGKMTMETNAATSVLAAVAQPLGVTNGYQHLKKVLSGDAPSSSVLSFEQGPGAPLRVFLVGDEKSTLFVGDGIGYRLDDAIPFILRRRTAEATCFVTVYDLSGKGAVSAAELLPVRAGKTTLATWEGLGLRLGMGRESLLVGIDLRQKTEGGTTVADQAFERLLIQPVR